MPRRMITSDINFNEKVASLPDAGRLLIIGIFINADDDGRLRASAKYLKAHIFPYDADKTIEQVQGWRDNCEEAGLIRVYANGDKELLDIPGWLDHQTIRRDRYSPSKLPKFEDCQPSGNHVTTTPQPKLSKDKLIEGNIIPPSETKGAPSTPEIIEHPSKNSQTDKKKTLPPSEVTQVLSFIKEKIGHEIPYPAKENTAVKRALSMDFTPDEIKGCWELMKGQQFWKDKWLPLAKVTENLGEYRSGRLGDGTKTRRVKGSHTAADFTGNW